MPRGVYKRKKTTVRPRTRRAPARHTPEPKKLSVFVVYVTYPNSLKEYSYLCDFPCKQGDSVLGNNDQLCRVVRTAATDSMAFRYVRPIPDLAESERKNRIMEIVKRLNELHKEVAQMDLFLALSRKNPEAKRLLSELKDLRR